MVCGYHRTEWNFQLSFIPVYLQIFQHWEYSKILIYHTIKMARNSSSENSEEIDLLSVFMTMGNFLWSVIKGIFTVIAHIIAFSFRRWYLILFALVAGVGLSYLIVLIQKNAYSSDLILKSNAVENEEMISYIDRLQDLTNESNHGILAELLNISPDEAEAIKDINAYWFYDRNNDEIADGKDVKDKFQNDTTYHKVDWKFGVRAVVSDPNVFNSLSNGLVYYVNSNDYFVKMNRLRLENLEKMISQTQVEVEKIDSLQKNKYFEVRQDLRQLGGQLVFTNDPVIQLFHEDILSLVRRNFLNQENLEIHDGVISVLEGFTVTQKPKYDMVFYIKILVPILLGIIYLLAFYMRYRKQIESYFNTGKIPKQE